MRNFDTMEISLALPSVKAKALANFVKRVDFETVARVAFITIAADARSEAELMWQALGELRSALPQAGAPRAAPPGTAPPMAAPGAEQTRSHPDQSNAMAAEKPGAPERPLSSAEGNRINAVTRSLRA